MNLRKTLLPTSRAYCAVVAIVAALGGCASPTAQEEMNLQEDRQICAAMGADTGSHWHAPCMLRQQERRDREELLNTERAQLSQQAAKIT